MIDQTQQFNPKIFINLLNAFLYRHIGPHITADGALCYAYINKDYWTINHTAELIIVQLAAFLKNARVVFKSTKTVRNSEIT